MSTDEVAGMRKMPMRFGHDGGTATAGSTSRGSSITINAPVQTGFLPQAADAERFARENGRHLATMIDQGMVRLPTLAGSGVAG